MPNWCHNVLCIAGPAEDIAAYISKTTKKDGVPQLLFNDEVPVPESETDVEPYYDAWGTKWETHGAEWDYTEGSMVCDVQFETAWGPPIAWMRTVSAKYPTLLFQLDYDECGCEIRGIMLMKAGELFREYIAETYFSSVYENGDPEDEEEPDEDETEEERTARLERREAKQVAREYFSEVESLGYRMRREMEMRGAEAVA
jgi:hypothetical protein